MPVSAMASILDEIHLSPSEQKVLKCIPATGETTTKKMAARYYRADGEVPHNGQIVISNIVRSLEKKTARTTIKVKRGGRKGPHAMTVWLEHG
jgi:hypothetical protein